MGLAKPASNPYGDGSWVKCKDDGALPEDVEKAKALIKDYGKPVEFKMLVTATPRGRAVGQVDAAALEAMPAPIWRSNMVEQATIPPRGFQRQFQVIALAHRRSRRSRSADVCQLQHRQPGGVSPTPRMRSLTVCCDKARTTADTDKRIDLYCEITRLINKEAIWFWTFQNTYYAISTAKVKGLPKMYSGVIDVSRTWKE